MKRANWIVALAGALLTVAGCSWSDVSGFLMISSPTAEANGEYVVVQTVDEVALMVQVSLDRLGLKAVSTPQGNGLVLDSTTNKGNKFRVFVTSDGEQRTRMRLEWIDTPERDVQALVVTGVQATLMPAQKK